MGYHEEHPSHAISTAETPPAIEHQKPPAETGQDGPVPEVHIVQTTPSEPTTHDDQQPEHDHSEQHHEEAEHHHEHGLVNHEEQQREHCAPTHAGQQTEAHVEPELDSEADTTTAEDVQSTAGNEVDELTADELRILASAEVDDPEESNATEDKHESKEPTEVDAFLAGLPDDLPPRYLAFLNQKGGVGKTTSTVNLGAAIAELGKRVLLIDLDPQAHLTLHLGIEPGSLETTLYDLLTDDETSAMEIVQEAKENLYVLPAEVNLAGVESELAADMMTGRAQRVLRNKCQGLLEATPFDFIMIDCPPSLGLLTINALTLANEVVVPMQAHFLALQGLSKLLETVHLVRQGFNPQLSVAGIVLCMHERQTLLAGEIQSDLIEFLESARGTDQPWANAEVYTPPIRRNIKLAESPSFGQSIFDYAPDCHGAADYRKLAKSLLEQSVRLQQGVV